MSAGSRRPSALSILRMGRLRRTIALSLSACLVAALLPWTVLAQAPGPDYSGAAEGTAAEVTIGEPGTPPAPAPPVEVTVGEATGAVNSDAGIIPDSPASPENEAEDFAVGSATPARVDVGENTILQPGSVQSSAPADAGGQRTVIDVDQGPIDIGVLTGTTQSSAATDGSAASTTNRASVSDVIIEEGVVSLGAATADANVSRTPDGLVQAFGASAIDEPTSLLGGLITTAVITAASTSMADGTDSSNVTDFLITDLALRAAAGGDPLITFNVGPSADPGLVALTITIAGSTVPIELTVPRGANLLDPSTYAGSSLAPLSPFGVLLTALVGPGGPLEGTELIVGGGFSEQGDGTFSRGLIEALRVGLSLDDGSIITAVLGRAFSAADATRAFSNVTDPETPPGTPPATNPDEAFASTRDSTPAETIFTAPVAAQNPAPAPTPAPTPTPTPDDGPPTTPVVDDMPEPPADDDAPPAEDDVPAEAADADPAPVDAPPEAAGDDELPFTGLGLAPVAGMGLLLVIGGSLVRVADRRRLREETAARQESELRTLLTLEHGDGDRELVGAGER